MSLLIHEPPGPQSLLLEPTRPSNVDLIRDSLDERRAALVTVIVCTRNRCARLRTALASLTQLDHDERFDCEILVVDNGSTDETRATVEAIAEGSLRSIRYVFEPVAGVVVARNRGVREAKGDWIAFFDDDQLADPRWLTELFSTAQSRGCLCVGGAVRLKLPDGMDRKLSPMVRMLLGETVGMDRPRKYSDRVTPGCGNLMIHRSVFAEVGLFDPRMADRGEDTELFLRIWRSGKISWFTPDAVIHHVIPIERLETSFLCNLSSRMAHGMAENERFAWGRMLYPAIWVARVGQAALRLFPRYLIARLKGDREGQLGHALRCHVAMICLRDGLKLVWTDLTSPGGASR